MANGFPRKRVTNDDVSCPRPQMFLKLPQNYRIGRSVIRSQT